MSNQVYSAQGKKYFASRGFNYYGIATNTTIAPTAELIISTIPGTQNDPANSFDIVPAGLVCRQEGMYSIMAKYEYARVTTPAGECNVALNMFIDGAVAVCSAEVNSPAISGPVTTKYFTLTGAFYMRVGEVLTIKIQNNNAAGANDVSVLAANTLISTVRIY